MPTVPKWQPKWTLPQPNPPSPTMKKRPEKEKEKEKKSPVKTPSTAKKKPPGLSSGTAPVVDGFNFSAIYFNQCP
jgi:hypothetical protein